MKVLLIVPPVRTGVPFMKRTFPLPLSLASIAAYARDKGFKDIEIKDFLVPEYMKPMKRSPPSFKGSRRNYIHYGWVDKDIIKWFEENDLGSYDIIGVASMQINVLEDGCCRIVNMIKNYTDSLVVIGGPSATTVPEFALLHSKTDYIIKGEGEIPFSNFLRDYDINDLPEKGIYNDRHIMIENLDDLPYPAWDLVDLELYPTYRGGQRIVLLTSRGCPYDCNFCSVKTIFGKETKDGCLPYWRRHSAEYVINKIKWLYDEFNARYFCILDDNLLADISRAEEILDGIENLEMKKIGFYIEEGLMVKQVAENPQIIERLKRLKFENVPIGLETFSTKTIEYIKKPETLEQFTEAVDIFNKFKLTPNVFYILGFKTDTIQSMLECMFEITKFKVVVRVNNLQLLPGTDLWKEYEEEGLIPKNYDYRLSSFYTIPTENFTFEDILNLRRVLKGVNYGLVNKVDVFRDDLETLNSRLNVSWDSNNVTMECKITYSRIAGQATAFLRILACRIGFSGIKVRRSESSITILNQGKLNKVEKELRSLFRQKGYPSVVNTLERFFK